MKIALFVHCFFPGHYHGTETYTFTLAKSLQDLGHKVTVVSCIPLSEKRSESLLTQYEYQGIQVYCIDKNHIPHHTLYETYYQPGLKRIHKDLLLELSPDIVHVTHLINHTAALLDTVHDLNIPTVATFTDFFGICLNNQLVTADGKLCAGPNVQRTNCFTCIGKMAISRLAPGISNKTITFLAPFIKLCSIIVNYLSGCSILRNSYLIKLFHTVQARPGILASRYGFYNAVIAPTNFLKHAYQNNNVTNAPIYRINFGIELDRKPKPIRSVSTPIRFGYIGQLAQHKGIDLLVEAFCRLPVGQSDLYIYGDIEQSPTYTNAVRRRCKNYPVFFKGVFPTDKMRAVLDELDFLVIPSTWYENSPLVLLNALASHTPVIVSNVEGLTEFLQEGNNGYAFTRGNIADLERVLRLILESPESSRKLSLTTNYTRTTMDMTQEIMAIYNSIL